MLFKVGDNTGFDVEGKTVKGLFLFAYLQAQLVNVGLTIADYDQSKINLKVVLHRGGKTEKIYNGNLLAIVKASMYKDSAYIPATQTPLVYQLHTSSLTELAIVPAYVHFGGPINLRGSDKIRVEINFPAAAASANLNVNTQIDCKPIECVDVEHFVPQIEIQSVIPGQQDIDVSLGDNVKSVIWVNFDKTTSLIADQIITTGNFTSDKKERSFNYFTLLTNRVRKFLSYAEVAVRYQTFELIDSQTPLHGVQLALQVNTANVAQGQNHIVVFTGQTSARGMQLAHNATQRHAIENLHKGGFSNATTHANLASLNNLRFGFEKH